MSNIQTKKRDLNIELLRIFAMIMVVTLHCLGHSKLNATQDMSIYNIFLVRFLEVLALPANTIFLLITGYYLIDKKFNLKKILCLWGKTIFYSTIIWIVCLKINRPISSYDTIFPVLSGQYWFISAYIVLYFLAPIINIGLSKINKKQFTFLIIILLLMISVLKLFFNPAQLFSGMMPVFLIYMLGAYLRKYGNEINLKKPFIIKYFLIAIITTLCYFIIKILSNSVANIILKFILTRMLETIRDYSFILTISMAVLIFMKFKTINIKSNIVSKTIKVISPSIFSIYLIHENVNLRTLWLSYGFENFTHSVLLIPYVLLVIAIVFFASFLIDLIRRLIYSLIRKIRVIDSIINKLNEQIDKVTMKINNYIS